MKAPLSWLKDYVDIDVSAEELQKKLFSCGFEVEELIKTGKDISGVVVGEVTECEPVEGTHLHVCKVDCGKHGIFQICCGADNVKKGIKAPCALVGATVYATAKDHTTVEGVTTIKKGKLRGIESDGMLCSGVEIGVNGDLFEGGDYCGLLILPSDAENGADVKQIVGLDDYIFDIAVTANRPDCQSILGIAREVAAALGKPLKEPDYSYSPKGVCAPVNISVEDADLCPRYIGHCVTDVKIAPSPAFIKKRLALCGLRSINNIVDITNFVLLEMGQPMHAFDLRALSDRTIVVRRAKNGEYITTLDENEFKLTPENLVICDSKKPVALAGVMGGLNSEIENDTTEVLFEAAKFARDSVRKTSRALGQHSDSSAIFEKGVYEYTTERAMARALHLIEQLGCGTVTDMHVDVKTEFSHTGEKTMKASVKKINALLGVDVPAAKTIEILRRLNFGVKQSGDSLSVTVPPYREDIDGEPDIAEEVIRFYGYDNIVGTFLPTAAITNGGYTEAQKAVNKLKRVLVGNGLYEISTYSFYSEKDLDMLKFPQDSDERKTIKILNPIGEDLSVMRRTLAPSMINTIVRNQRRLNPDGKLFELAKIYIPHELPIKNFPEERNILCLGAWGATDFFELKGVCESVADCFNTKFSYSPKNDIPFLHPGVAAAIYCDGEYLGYLGMLAPTIAAELSLERKAFVAEIDYDKLTAHAKAFEYVPVPKFPEEKRDLALVCDKNITCGEIEAEILSACKYATEAKLFDVYEGEQVGEGKKSMAFTVTFTPKDEDIGERIDGFVKKILNNLKYKLNVELR